MEPGGSIELDGFGIDISLTTRTRYTFFTTLVGETLDGTNRCNGFDFLECTIGFNLTPIFPTMMPTPMPTITPFPTQDPEFNACDVAVDISCSVNSLAGISCDQIRAPNGDSCPFGADLEPEDSFGPDLPGESECQHPLPCMGLMRPTTFSNFLAWQ